MMKNLLFFDIDGTLITNDKRKMFPQDALKALVKTRENGNLIFINTGRVFCNIDDYIKDIGFDGYVCGCGSNIIYHNKVLLHNELSKKLCRDVAEKCREYKMGALYEYSDFTAYDIAVENSERDILVEYFSKNNRRIITDIYDKNFQFDKFSAWYTEESRLSEFEKYIEKYFTYIDREGDFCELEPEGFSKATGIEFLLNYFNLSKENVYVFGDGNNDIEMMNFAGHSVCMKKGSYDAIKAAEFVTDDVMDGGIKKALEYYNLL